MTEIHLLGAAEAAKLVINETPQVCPTCGSGEHRASVYRDGGSVLYCNACRDRAWPNPDHERGARILARLRAEAATP